MIDTIDRLLAVADPDGEPARLLKKWRGQLERHVMLGPGPISYINGLLRRLDNPECRWLTNDGRCLGRNAGAYCPYNEPNGRFSACNGFDSRPRAPRSGKEIL